MEAFGLVRLFVNKTLVSKEARRRGNHGYPRLQAVRLLVYAKLRGLERFNRKLHKVKSLCVKQINNKGGDIMVEKVWLKSLLEWFSYGEKFPLRWWCNIP